MENRRCDVIVHDHRSGGNQRIASDAVQNRVPLIVTAHGKHCLHFLSGWVILISCFHFGCAWFNLNWLLLDDLGIAQWEYFDLFCFDRKIMNLRFWEQTEVKASWFSRSVTALLQTFACRLHEWGAMQQHHGGIHRDTASLPRCEKRNPTLLLCKVWTDCMWMLSL